MTRRAPTPRHGLVQGLGAVGVPIFTPRDHPEDELALHNFRTVRRPDCPVCPCGTYDMWVPGRRGGCWASGGRGGFGSGITCSTGHFPMIIFLNPHPVHDHEVGTTVGCDGGGR